MNSAYNQKLIALTNQYNFLITDFVKYFVFFNKNPSVDEYRNLYNSNKGQIQSVFTDLVTLKSNIEKEVGQMNSKVQLITTEINNNEKIYNNLFTLNLQSSNTRDGSVSLIDETKEIYNKQYYLNVELFIGILLLLFMYFNPFSKQTTNLIKSPITKSLISNRHT